LQPAKNQVIIKKEGFLCLNQGEKMSGIRKYLNFPVIASFCALIYVVVFSAWESLHREVKDAYRNRIVIEYWEKWTGAEYDSMKVIVDEFNDSQNKIYVKMLAISSIEQKLMLATAGGNPPDVAGIWSHSVNTFAPKGALTPLNKYLKNAGISKDKYIPVFWDLCSMYDFIWGLPSTPATLALHWNKKLFSEAGLDPECPPKNLAELDKFAEALTLVKIKRGDDPKLLRYSELTESEKKAKDFKIVKLGYTPSIPGWFNEMWPFWFGGRLWNGTSEITADKPANLAAAKWYKSFSQKYGLRNLQEFGSSFGNFASPQDPFLSGKVSMVLQGVWLHNFISKYAPQLEWGAAAFPSISARKLPDVTIAECDILVIPKGAKHPAEAFEFIKFVSTQKNMEKLALGQRKFSPLAKVSADFIKKHPNPYIKVFIDLAKSPNARYVPRMPVWNEYKNESIVAYDQIFTGLMEPEQALGELQKRSQWKLDRVLKRWNKIKKKRFKEWSNLDD
jgi:ABC-type glycerol-3-phosphate transport system substrate-binding protein